MLKPARREKATKAPLNWQQLPHGLWLKQQLSETLAPHTAKMFGYYSARLGHLAAQLELPELRLQHDFSVAADAEPKVRAELEHLPFAESALDAVFLVGQLEFERDPHQVLREVSRSLIADGYVVIAGFNPLSPALLTGLWPSNLRQLPWCGRYFTKARICDWLSLLNFEVVASGYVGATLMWSATKRPDFAFARLSQMAPPLRSMYYLVARKREFPLTVVRVRKRNKPRMSSMPVANRVK
ncbi:methyltransferase domain-containing protein [Pseudidiomarina woesei]|uniref:Methyltransferase domain n=1 Tax=Pseudidiomarina woesei TaxID=1381080 RepID=A0A0K6H153_9GAMM|nr:methyltransferase domain-containing protein [Pseudidiomarina woesei]CUA84712.1 Methyltransferase domain [Pseudidiomarina woesei]